MDINNSDQLINKYFEGTLTSHEKETVENYREQSSSFQNEFEDMENVFDLLESDNFLIDPPINFADQIMATVAIKQNNFNNINIIQIFSKSLIAAGILLFIFNIVSFNFSIDNFNVPNILLRMSSDINEAILKPFVNLPQYLNF